MRLNFNNLQSDLFGGITAAVVALPLALAFGVSSGAGPLAGLYGAICVGFFAALFGGTATQVSGPTGPMTVVMAATFTQFAALDPENGISMAFSVVMLGGLFQILFGYLRLGNYITLVPFPVISGFMTGIGAIIILIELGPLLGHESASSVKSAITHLPEQIASLNGWALLLGLGSLLIIFGCPKSIGKRIPPALLALILGSIASILMPADAQLAVIGAIPTGLPEFHLPTWQFEHLQAMVSAAIVLAALGSVDSLLTSLVADSMTKTQHNSDKELIGQGIGNLVSGFVGGLPGAGATMRTVVNIRAGGKTPISGATHAVVLLLIVMGLGSLAESIPHAVLAGILLKVGIDIIDWPFIARLHRVPLLVSSLTLLVFGLTVFVDLITAVLVGMFIANVITVKRLTEIQVAGIQDLSEPEFEHTLGPVERYLLKREQGRVALYAFHGPFSYASSKGIRIRLSRRTDAEIVMLDLTEVPMVDVSTALAIEEIVTEQLGQGRQVVIIGANSSVRNVFDRLDLPKRLGENSIFSTRQDALRAYSE